MLKGYSVPRTPLGLAAVTPPPPWHYSGDLIGVEYWADPKATACLLPDGLSPDPQTNGHATLLFGDWQFTASGEELLDPARYQCRECLILIDAVWRDMPVTFCPFDFVDNDAAIARGWVKGYPRRLGSVFQTRSFSAPSPAAAPIAPGSRFTGSLSACGRRLAAAHITLRQAEPDVTKIFSRPVVNLRWFPRLEAGKHEKPTVEELVLSVTDDLQIVEMWTGEGDICLPRNPGEEMQMLTPVRTGMGFRCSVSFSVTDLKILESPDSRGYVPHVG
ncbi:MAG: acetoacetate decarboxylase [Nevskia sp.]|nr:acetoacetate decarboxylase [Nevskia sp.]